MKFIDVIISNLLIFTIVQANWFKTNNKMKDTEANERCFCQLKGKIDDCSCSIETIDNYNNKKMYPMLSSILRKDFFRYWKVNLNKGCPFWDDDSRCVIRYCNVKESGEVPEGIKRSCMSEMLGKSKYFNAIEEEEECEKTDLGFLNTTISEKSRARFVKWAEYDDAQDNFCYFDDEFSNDSQYVDLLLNPERFTGYDGPSAHRIWNAIYQENCFRPDISEKLPKFTNIKEQDILEGLCLEKRTFYRTVSGLHSSISIHLSANYLLSDKEGFMDSPEGVWGPNFEEFRVRFDPSITDGCGPARLKNLYFLYLLELRAIHKIGPYLDSLEYFTGNAEEDKDTKNAIWDILNVVRSFPNHFDERTLFASGDQAKILKTEFRNHFRNVSRIMDCVGCDKCMLWGKLQTTGLGTALKVLFSGKFNDSPIKELTVERAKTLKFHLTRNEIVSLFNAFGRLSTSIYSLEMFSKD